MVENYTKDIKESVYHRAVVSVLAVGYTMLGKTLIKMSPPSLTKFDIEDGVKLVAMIAMSDFTKDYLIKQKIIPNKKLQGALLVVVRWVGEIHWSSLLSYLAIMCQSIPSLTIPPGKAPGNFLKGQIPHPPGHKDSVKSRPLGQKNHAKSPPPGTIIFKNPAKNKIMRQKL